MYQFTAIDIRTRMRFIAYGQVKSFANGWAFILLVVLWLRGLGLKGILLCRVIGVMSGVVMRVRSWSG